MTSSTASSPNSSGESARPFYLQADEGRRFALLHSPAPPTPVRGGIVFVPPFAEELNRSRRAIAEASRAFARSGWQVLRLDLYGCGDSEGDFQDATWARWQADIALALDWTREQLGREPIVWALRAGILLAQSALRHRNRPARVVAWQPVHSGDVHLTQFLRMRVAADAFAAGTRVTTQALRESIRSGQTVEVAGYPLTEALVGPLAASKLEPDADWCRELILVEASEDAAVSPATLRVTDRAGPAGVAAHAQATADPAFWQTIEVEEAPALTAATVAWLQQCQEVVA